MGPVKFTIEELELLAEALAFYEEKNDDFSLVEDRVIRSTFDKIDHFTDLFETEENN